MDIIVTELVDSGLLGERIIPVLADARARGLLARGGRVIPEVLLAAVKNALNVMLGLMGARECLS